MCCATASHALDGGARENTTWMICDLQDAGMDGQKVFSRSDAQESVAGPRCLLSPGDVVDAANDRNFWSGMPAYVAKRFRVEELSGPLRLLQTGSKNRSIQTWV